jgi:hypothetical protein
MVAISRVARNIPHHPVVDGAGGGPAVLQPSAALGQAEVPAGVVAGDHVGDAEPDQQDPAGGAFLQLTVLEVVGVDAFEVDPGSCGRMAGLFEGHGFFTSILLLSTPVFPVVCCTW